MNKRCNSKYLGECVYLCVCVCVFACYVQGYRDRTSDRKLGFA